MAPLEGWEAALGEKSRGVRRGVPRHGFPWPPPGLCASCGPFSFWFGRWPALPVFPSRPAWPLYFPIGLFPRPSVSSGQVWQFCYCCFGPCVGFARHGSCRRLRSFCAYVVPRVCLQWYACSVNRCRRMRRGVLLPSCPPCSAGQAAVGYAKGWCACSPLHGGALAWPATTSVRWVLPLFWSGVCPSLLLVPFCGRSRTRGVEKKKKKRKVGKTR